MSLKSLLMPTLTRYLFSEARLTRVRRHAETRRRRQGHPLQVHYFHQVDDPYSVLAAQVLPYLLERYEIHLVSHIVSPPVESAMPDRLRWQTYSRQDAQVLATVSGLDFSDTGRQPDVCHVQLAQAVLAEHVRAGYLNEAVAEVSRQLWSCPEELCAYNRAEPMYVDSTLRVANRLRERWGHYAGAMFYCSDEWYWGLDRLHYLERRLQELGLDRSGGEEVLFAPRDTFPESNQKSETPVLDFYFSLRSPYSAIVVPRIFQLARQHDAKINLRYVLPLVMRGLPVPRAKRTYIVLDAAREARLRAIPFGCINDPLGKPTERGLALMPFAESRNQGPAYLQSFMSGVWAEGLDAGSDRGLRRIVERAHLPWEEARIALQDDSWRLTAEDNRRSLFAAGLWGVPAFVVNQHAVWGQDRLWRVDAALR